ncbi:MAG: response regulator transcription factor [Clostridium sp.]
MSEKIKVVVVDDHDLIREGLNRILSFEDNLEILGKCRNGREVVELLSVKQADVVLLDINMPEMNGLDALRHIKKTWPCIKVVMLTVEDDRKTINDAIDIGADAYILKESAGIEVVNAIKSVFEGEKYIDKALVRVIFSHMKIEEKKENQMLELLTDRELNILLLISKGLKNKDIAETLFLSEKTVKNYVTNVFRKIKVEDRVQATIFAIKNNIEEFVNNKLI